VDDDDDIARYVELNLCYDGFRVRRVCDGASALAAIDERLPDLVLLDLMMPRMDGLEVCRRLRANPETVGLPVIALTARNLSADRVVGLTAGADDYIVKPFDTVELIARVRSALRRNSEMRAVSPLSGLPGNTQIHREIGERVLADSSFAVCYLDLDEFKLYNDRYGFLRGDEVIMLLARCLREAARETDPRPFLGHVGGDDFVYVCLPGQAEALCRAAMAAFDARIGQLYDPEDRDRGYLVLTDRRGRQVTYPLVSVSAGVATTERRWFDDPREAVAIATEMKAVAKRSPGSTMAVDRRSGPQRPTAG
jgi:DNA-binding response OmpR family regulator